MAEHQRTQGLMRWVVLGLMSLIIFANYYLYDSFSTLKELIQTDLGFSSGDYGVIRSFYNVPNTFLLMALIGGIILDKLGIRRTGFLFTILCALGGLLQAYGVSPTFRGGGFGYDLMGSFFTQWSPEMKMMVFGRFLFGLGAETQIVMLNKVLAKWFMGKELALAFGLNLGIARLGSALAMGISPKLAITYGWNSALWLGAVVMVSGLVLFIVYMLIDLRDEQHDNLANADAGKLAPDEEFHFRDIVNLVKNNSYLFIVLLCAAFYAAVFPFLDYLADLLTHTRGFSTERAGNLTSLVPYGAAVFTVVFGAFVDWKGKRATLMIGGSLLLMVSFVLFGQTMINPWLIVPLFGIAFSLVPAAMWPAVALLVKEQHLGTAYGLMTWFQNLCWWAIALLAGHVLDWTNPGITPEVLRAGTGHYDYRVTMAMFAGIAAVAFVLAIALKRTDSGPNGHGLELPSAEAAELNAS